MTAIVVAAMSARALAQAAVREGWQVVVLDIFGDVDTCAAAERWCPIGSSDALAIDGGQFIDALQGVARRGEAGGWIAGSGFEGRADLLEAGNAVLPLIGTPAAAVRRVRDPALFFGCLAAHGIGFPEIDLHIAHAGWLVKEAAGSGGLHIRRHDGADAMPLPAGCYAQRELKAPSMSATYIANGHRAVVLGVNEQIVRPLGPLAFVFHGVVGPVAVSPAVLTQLDAAVNALTGEFGLCGMGSLDFLLDDAGLQVLECNPRPPASLALYPHVGAAGPLHAHLRACVGRELPPPLAADGTVRGNEILYAPHGVHVDAVLAAAIAAAPGAQDLPRAGTRIGAGEPLCTVAASGTSAAHVHDELARRRTAVLNLLETPR